MTTHTASTPPNKSTAGWFIYPAIVAWLAAVMVGWGFIANYEYSVNTPLPNSIVSRWPEQTALVRQEKCPTMLFFLHPKCPCSHASLSELEGLLSFDQESAEPAPDLIVVVTVPANANESWTGTPTLERAKRLANARLYFDSGGIEAARFGATTSGLVMFFDRAGDRQYAGGITMARGHEGANVGRDCLAEVLRGAPLTNREIPAFGCRLCLPEPIRNQDVVEPLSLGGPNTRS